MPTMIAVITQITQDEFDQNILPISSLTIAILPSLQKKLVQGRDTFTLKSWLNLGCLHLPKKLPGRSKFQNTFANPLESRPTPELSRCSVVETGKRPRKPNPKRRKNKNNLSLLPKWKLTAKRRLNSWQKLCMLSISVLYSITLKSKYRNHHCYPQQMSTQTKQFNSQKEFKTNIFFDKKD